jgi:hypothetical protein
VNNEHDLPLPRSLRAKLVLNLLRHSLDEKARETLAELEGFQLSLEALPPNNINEINEHVSESKRLYSQAVETGVPRVIIEYSLLSRFQRPEKKEELAGYLEAAYKNLKNAVDGTTFTLSEYEFLGRALNLRID